MTYNKEPNPLYKITCTPAYSRRSPVKITTCTLHNLFNKLIHLPFMSLFLYYIQLGASGRGVTDGRGPSRHVIAFKTIHVYQHLYHSRDNLSRRDLHFILNNGPFYYPRLVCSIVFIAYQLIFYGYFNLILAFRVTSFCFDEDFFRYFWIQLENIFISKTSFSICFSFKIYQDLCV